MTYSSGKSINFGKFSNSGLLNSVNFFGTGLTGSICPDIPSEKNIINLDFYHIQELLE